MHRGQRIGPHPENSVKARRRLPRWLELRSPRPSSVGAGADVSNSPRSRWRSSSSPPAGRARAEKLPRGARLTAPRFARHALGRQPRAPDTSSWLRQVAMNSNNCIIGILPRMWPRKENQPAARIPNSKLSTEPG